MEMILEISFVLLPVAPSLFSLSFPVSSLSIRICKVAKKHTEKARERTRQMHKEVEKTGSRGRSPDRIRPRDAT